MLSKNWSNDARIGFLLTTWVVKDFFIVEDRMFDNYEDELIKASLFRMLHNFGHVMVIA